MKKKSLAGISSMVSFGSFDFKYFQWLLDNYRNNHVDSQLFPQLLQVEARVNTAI